MATEEDQRIAGDNASRRESGEEPKSLTQRAEDVTLRLRDFMKLAHEVSIKAVRKITKFAMIPSFLLALVIFLIAILPALLTKI